MAREYTREIYLYINGKEVSNDIKSIKREMNLLTNEQNRMTIGSREYVEAGKRIKILKGIIQEHNTSLRQVDKTWRSTLNNIGDQFNRFQTLGMAVIGGLVGVVQAFRKTAEASNLFEERLDNLSALTGLTGKELAWLGEKAKETSVSVTDSGVRIKQSATDILDAYTKMGSQRPELLKDKEALHEVTQAAIILSEAGKMQLEPATAALATTLNQFNLSAGESTRVINTIAAGSKVGAGEIDYITEVFEKSGTTAALLGMSVEQMVGTVEGIAPKFSNSMRAGTALDRVLLKMRQQGIGVKDGVFDLNRAIDELRIRFSRGESAADLFGVEQAKMGEILVMNQGDINAYTKAVTGTNIAIEQATINTSNNSATLAQAKNKVQLMYIEIGEKLAPAIIRSTNAWNMFLRLMMSLPEFIQKNKILLVGLGGAILAYNGALLKSIAASIADQAAKIKNAIVTKHLAAQKAIDIAMTEVQATQTARLTIVQRTAVLAQLALNKAMQANPLGLVIAGVTALVAALMYFNKHSRANIALETTKKALVDELTQSNNSLKATYSEIGDQISSLNKLSVQEKADLQEKIDKTIRLAEAEISLLESRRNGAKAENTKVTFGQFVVGVFNPNKLREKARANALKAVEPIDTLIEEQKDRLKSLREQQNELFDVLSAESLGDDIGTSTMSELEARLDKYTSALRNVVVGSADYIRIQGKVRETEAQLAKARGANLAGEEGLEKTFENRQNLMKANSTAYQELLGNLSDMEKEQQRELNELLEGDLDKLTDEKNLFGLSDQDKKQMAEYNYWLKSTYDGQREMLRDQLAKNEIAYAEYAEKIKDLEKEAAQKKIETLETWADATRSLLESVTDFYGAQKERELAAAGKDDKKKEAIEKKFAKRQKTLATLETVMEGAVEIARINSNAGVNADLTQTLRIILTAAAVARTAGTVALIQSQQFARGRYPVMGAVDHRVYQASLLPSIKTGIYNRPTLGLFSEREPEIVIDGPTTRNIRANFPEILSAIQAVRVPQYAKGKDLDLPASGVGIPEEIAELLRANIRMMKEVQDAHERPAVVSFQSIRRSLSDFDQILTKTKIG